MTIFPNDAMVFGFAFALSAMFWLGAGIYWIESFFFPLDSLRLLVLPLACGASLLPLVFGGVRCFPCAAAPLFAAFPDREHRLRPVRDRGAARDPDADGRAAPAVAAERRARRLDGLDRELARDAAAAAHAGELLFRLIGAGFVLLTLTLASGILFSEQVDARALRLDHKTVFAILSWLMFGGSLVARKTSGWRGRGAARWVLVARAAARVCRQPVRFEVLLHRSVV